MSLSRKFSMCKVGDIEIIQSETKNLFKWEIPNYSVYNVMKSGEIMTSNRFSSGGPGCLYEWELELYPAGETEEEKDFLSLYLCSLEKVDIEVEFKITLLNDRRKVVYEVDSKKRTFGPVYTTWGFKKFIEREKIKDLLRKDKLTFICEIISTTRNDQRIIDQCTSRAENPYALDVLTNIEKLLDDPKYHDVKFIFDGKALHAHRSILSSSSPVFAAMFEHDMLEGIRNEVLIKDISYEIFKEMLRFVYCGRVQEKEMKKIDKELLAAADKYAITKLKSKCEESMCDSLSYGNAIEYFSIADLYSAAKLRQEVKDFMAANATEIVHKPEFQAFGNLDTELMIEVVRALVPKKMIF